jgi:hypothetical protein
VQAFTAAHEEPVRSGPASTLRLGGVLRYMRRYTAGNSLLFVSDLDATVKASARAFASMQRSLATGADDYLGLAPVYSKAGSVEQVDRSCSPVGYLAQGYLVHARTEASGGSVLEQLPTTSCVHELNLHLQKCSTFRLAIQFTRREIAVSSPTTALPSNRTA